MDEQVLNAIARANEEESKIYLKAALNRRKEFLDGGEILCREFSKEWVAHREKIMERVREIQREEEQA